MTPFEQQSIIVGIAGALATFLAVLVALFGERLRQRWSAPKLRIELFEPAITTTNAGVKGWYYLLRVSNQRRTSPAANVRVLLTKIERKAPDGTWVEEPFSGPVQVTWRWPDLMAPYQTVGPSQIATFACVHQNDQEISLRLYWHPNNMRRGIAPSATVRLSFIAASDVAESAVLPVEVAWDGKWNEDAYTASVTTSNRCEVTVTAYAQNDSRWANKKYDHLTAGDTTIGRWGCALTSLAMALTFAGHTVAPDSLNAFMIANEGFDASAVSWLATVPSFSSGGLEWVDLPRTNSPAELATAVCSGNPVIVYVPSLVTTRQDGTPGSHFVLVTGGPREATDSTSLGEFSIVDPNPASGATTLDPYGSFVLRGYPGTGAQQGTLAGNAMIGSVTAADASQRRLQFITVGGTLLVTDPQGRRVGQEAPGGSIISEIPGALFDRDETPDHHEAAVTTAPQVARVTLPEAASGVYRIDFSATTSIPNAMVRVRAELADRRIVTNSASLSVTAGAVYTFDVAYDRDSSTAPILTPTLPGWAPNVQYSLGDQVSFQGLDYECRQAHTSQVGWEPPMVYALWARINAGETWAPQVLYETGQEVSYQGVRYRALQGHQSQPGWEPPHVPALWTVAN
jgi:hypothetical protein